MKRQAELYGGPADGTRIDVDDVRYVEVPVRRPGGFGVALYERVPGTAAPVRYEYRGERDP